EHRLEMAERVRVIVAGQKSVANLETGNGLLRRMRQLIGRSLKDGGALSRFSGLPETPSAIELGFADKLAGWKGFDQLVELDESGEEGIRHRCYRASCNIV